MTSGIVDILIFRPTRTLQDPSRFEATSEHRRYGDLATAQSLWGDKRMYHRHGVLMEATLCFGFLKSEWEDLKKRLEENDEDAWLRAIEVWRGE